MSVPLLPFFQNNWCTSFDCPVPTLENTSHRVHRCCPFGTVRWRSRWPWIRKRCCVCCWRCEDVDDCWRIKKDEWVRSYKRIVSRLRSSLTCLHQCNRCIWTNIYKTCCWSTLDANNVPTNLNGARPNRSFPCSHSRSDRVDNVRRGRTPHFRNRHGLMGTGSCELGPCRWFCWASLTSVWLHCRTCNRRRRWHRSGCWRNLCGIAGKRKHRCCLGRWPVDKWCRWIVLGGERAYHAGRVDTRWRWMCQCCCGICQWGNWRRWCLRRADLVDTWFGPGWSTMPRGG